MARNNAPDGRRIFLREHDVRDRAVIGAVLPGTARDRPAADAAVFKGLREVPAGISALCAEELRCALQRFFELRTGHARLHGDGLVGFVKADDLVEALAHVKRHPAFNGLHSARDRAAAAVDIQRDLIFNSICHKLLDLLGRVRIDDHIREVLDLLVPQTQKVIARAAVSDRKAGIILGRYELVADDLFERLNVLRIDLRGVVGQIDLVKADVVGVILEIVVGHFEGFFHQFVKRFLRVLEEFGVAPAEDRTVAALRRGGQHPFRLKALIRFVAHSISLLFVILMILR